MKSIEVFEEKISAALKSGNLGDLQIYVDAYSTYVDVHVSAMRDGLIITDLLKKEE